ncbi:hypothetical protein CRYUN_Cryun05aG0235400 [Craigia yunnanensis]
MNKSRKSNEESVSMGLGSKAPFKPKNTWQPKPSREASKVKKQMHDPYVAFPDWLVCIKFHVLQPTHHMVAVHYLII